MGGGSFRGGTLDSHECSMLGKSKGYILPNGGLILIHPWYKLLKKNHQQKHIQEKVSLKKLRPFFRSENDPKWWFNGDLPWYKVKNHLKQIQEKFSLKKLKQSFPLTSARIFFSNQNLDRFNGCYWPKAMCETTSLPSSVVACNHDHQSSSLRGLKITTRGQLGFLPPPPKKKMAKLRSPAKGLTFSELPSCKLT